MNLENYIKNLAPDLQEKARACGSTEELLALAKEANVPVPDAVLESIAGGDASGFGNCTGITCPKCGSDDYTVLGEEIGAYGLTYHLQCNNCGHKWDETAWQ